MFTYGQPWLRVLAPPSVLSRRPVSPIPVRLAAPCPAQSFSHAFSRFSIQQTWNWWPRSLLHCDLLSPLGMRRSFAYINSEGVKIASV